MKYSNTKIMKWVIPIGFVALLIYALNNSRNLANDLMSYGVVTLGRVTQYSEARGKNMAEVRFGYYYNEKEYGRELPTSRSHEKGGYVYIILLPTEPDEGLIVHQRNVNEADTILNTIYDHVKLTKAEVRDIAKSGKIF